jgi:hypothetical protein
MAWAFVEAAGRYEYNKSNGLQNHGPRHHQRVREVPAACETRWFSTREFTNNCRCSQRKFMKLNTLEKMWDCMKRLQPRIEPSKTALQLGRRPIERMLENTAQ